jgi:hypothetical protein
MLPVKPAIVSTASDYVTTKEAQAKKIETNPKDMLPNLLFSLHQRI